LARRFPITTFAREDASTHPYAVSYEWPDGATDERRFRTIEEVLEHRQYGRPGSLRLRAGATSATSGTAVQGRAAVRTFWYDKDRPDHPYALTFDWPDGHQDERRWATEIAYHRATVRYPRVALVIPAHNEADTLVEALESVEEQSRPPCECIVVADNCTDATAAIAEQRGWTVWLTHENQDRKAGALNQAWARLATQLDDDDYVVFMDADTVLDPHFVANAVNHALIRPQAGGVCATFYGKEGGGWLGFLQRLEYARFARSLARKGGQTFVLSGTATLFPVRNLRELERYRGFLYDRTALIEDYEISLALRHRGRKMYAPRDCRVRTDVMPDVKTLWRQRLRWQRGTLHELRRYGWTRETLPDIMRQFLLVGATITRLLLVTMVALTVIVLGGLDVQWQWTALAGVIALERGLTVRHLGWRYVAVAMLLVVEELYGVFREAFFARSAWLAFFGGPEWQWHKT